MIILLCEGNSEWKLVNRALDENVFKFSRQDILGHRPFTAKQITKEISINLVMENDLSVPFDFYRIGDTLHDELIIDDYKAHPCTIKKFCTKPEIEILFLIHEGLYDRFCRECSATKRRPKEYAKSHIPDFDFDQEMARIDLRHDLPLYKKKHKNCKSKGEGYLADLLK